MAITYTGRSWIYGVMGNTQFVMCAGLVGAGCKQQCSTSEFLTYTLSLWPALQDKADSCCQTAMQQPLMVTLRGHWPGFLCTSIHDLYTADGFRPAPDPEHCAG